MEDELDEKHQEKEREKERDIERDKEKEQDSKDKDKEKDKGKGGASAAKPRKPHDPAGNPRPPGLGRNSKRKREEQEEPAEPKSKSQRKGVKSSTAAVLGYLEEQVCLLVCLFCSLTAPFGLCLPRKKRLRNVASKSLHSAKRSKNSSRTATTTSPAPC